MKNILNRGFSLRSASDLVTKVRLIITSLAGNANFLITAPYER